MPADASAVIASLSKLLREIPPEWAQRQRKVRQLLAVDPMERIVSGKLLGEGLGGLLAQLAPRRRPLVILFDRCGGGDGARAAAGLMPTIGSTWPGTQLIHVSFSTPPQGLGALVRGVVVPAGAEHGVDVHVVSHGRPSEGLVLDDREAEELIGACDLVITFAPGGVAGLSGAPTVEDRLLARSHLGVLSFPDPDALVGELERLEGVVGVEPDLHGLRFDVEVEVDGVFQEQGSARLGPGGDAADRLWVLLDNARRRRYRVLVQPLRNGAPSGDPLVCSCKTVIEQRLGEITAVERVVPGGSRLVAAVRGRETLT